MTYLNKDTKAQFTGVRVTEYKLPNFDDVIVRVKSQSMARMNRHAEAQTAGGERLKKDTLSLIAESIVDEDEERVWTADEVNQLMKSDYMLVKGLMEVVGRHNGGTDTEIEEMVGNLPETE